MKTIGSRTVVVRMPFYFNFVIHVHHVYQTIWDGDTARKTQV